MNNYSLVLEYADNGTLKTYLDEHFNELEWNNKFDFALQLANAVLCLHECDIIHRDLHASNILVHQKRIKLADFGLSKKIDEASNNTVEIFGVIPYVDPRSFNNQNNQSQHYKLNKKSDIYSIGIIMWQISSGRKPFYDEAVNYDLSLALAIKGGKREEIIDGTPIEYSNIYTKCWEGEPDNRPDIQEIVSGLRAINSTGNNIFMNSMKEIHGILPAYDSNSSSKLTSDINNSLVIDNIVIMDFCNDTSVPDINDVAVDKLINAVIERHNVEIINDQFKQLIDQEIQEILEILRSNHYVDIDELRRIVGKNFEENFKQLIDQEILEILQLNHNVDYNKLMDIIIERHSGDIVIDEFKQFIDQEILQLNQYVDELIKWLIMNQVKASEDNYSLAQVYLAKCYDDSTGIEKNRYLTFKWFQKSVENESIIGKYYLGYCYEYGIGIENDVNKSFHWYSEAAKNENKAAQYNLARYYENGIFIEKDETKAFELYKRSAEHGYLDARYKIAYFYNNGIGTKVDKEKAFKLFCEVAEKGNEFAQNNLGILYERGEGIQKDLERAFFWYNKAANNGNEIAQYNLGIFYEYGVHIKKDEVKAFELYMKSAIQSYSNAQYKVAYCYDKGIGIYINKEEAFYWYNVAAKNGNEIAQYNLGMFYEHGISTKKDEIKAFELYKKSARQGYLNAQYKIAYSYDNGIGTNVNKEKAFFWHLNFIRNRLKKDI
ncbi:HCP-like protein [Rhizophagus irregularis]|nr:HCP-like protein [Rhizophagus irregularis]